MDSEMVMHNGGCHCSSVRWRVHGPARVVVWQCNCSNCSMRGNTHFIVPSESFELLGDSKQFLTTYTFGTHTAKHTFCKVCGVTSFYSPRSNPDGIAITYRCVDAGTLTHIEIKSYDGKNWEDSYSKTGIASCSKVSDDELSKLVKMAMLHLKLKKENDLLISAMDYTKVTELTFEALVLESVIWTVCQYFLKHIFRAIGHLSHNVAQCVNNEL